MRVRQTRDTTWAAGVRREMGIPVQALWDLVTTPGILRRTHAFVRENPVVKWPGVGARDTVRYHSGMVLHRHFLQWNEGVGFDLQAVNPSGLWSAYVRWRFSPVGEHRSELTMTIEPDIMALAPRRLAPYLWRWQVKPFLTQYGEVVMNGFEHYAMTGQPVRRNQFGSLPAFSPWTLRARS